MEQAAQGGSRVTVPLEVCRKTVDVALRDKVQWAGGDVLMVEVDGLSVLLQPLWFYDSDFPV